VRREQGSRGAESPYLKAGASNKEVLFLSSPYLKKWASNQVAGINSFPSAPLLPIPPASSVTILWVLAVEIDAETHRFRCNSFV